MAHAVDGEPDACHRHHGGQAGRLGLVFGRGAHGDLRHRVRLFIATVSTTGMGWPGHASAWWFPRAATSQTAPRSEGWASTVVTVHPRTLAALGLAWAEAD